MPSTGSFFDEVLGALKLDFTCCNSESENIRRSESKERKSALVAARPPLADYEEEALTGPVLGDMLPTSPNFACKGGSGSETPTSASSQEHKFPLDLPMGQKTHSDPLSSSDCSEMSEVVDDSGARYRGQWLADQRHGHGVLIQIDGVRYEGQFQNDLVHGRGFEVDVDGSLYDGQWVDTHKHGFGTYTFPDGTTYEGQWADSKKHGTGSEQWADGAKFEGQFAEGFKNGAGVYKDSWGREYMGEFRGDKMDGIGTYVFECGRKYSGHWHEGLMHGQGKMEWTNGTMYEGVYENGFRSGLGTLSMPDGSSYCGQWSAGKQHGKGMYKDVQGVCWQETWDVGTQVTGAPRVGGEAGRATTPSSHTTPKASLAAIFDTPSITRTQAAGDADEWPAPSTAAGGSADGDLIPSISHAANSDMHGSQGDDAAQAVGLPSIAAKDSRFTVSG